MTTAWLCHGCDSRGTLTEVRSYGRRRWKCSVCNLTHRSINEVAGDYGEVVLPSALVPAPEPLE